MQPVVTAPKDLKESTKGHIFVGIWDTGDEYLSEIEYRVTSKGTTFKVEAIDGHDGEVADVFEVKWDGEELSFAAHWNSTADFVGAGCELYRRTGLILPLPTPITRLSIESGSNLHTQKSATQKFDLIHYPN